MRIIGGSHRGRTLLAPEGLATRPTSDRVRQSLFDLLGQRCDGFAVLDLYAGTGALALEALSRGATRAVLVEKDRAAIDAIEENLRVLKLGEQCDVRKNDVLRALDGLAGEQQGFELVFCDPPYALHRAQGTLDTLAKLGLVRPGGRVALESEEGEATPAMPGGFVLDDERVYGDTVMRIARRTAVRAQPGALDEGR